VEAEAVPLLVHLVARADLGSSRDDAGAALPAEARGLRWMAAVRDCVAALLVRPRPAPRPAAPKAIYLRTKTGAAPRRAAR